MLEEIVELEENEVELLLIQQCMQANNFETYTKLFGIVDLYKEAGLGLKFYYNLKNQEYSVIPFVKHVGFK